MAEANAKIGQVVISRLSFHSNPDFSEGDSWHPRGSVGVTLDVSFHQFCDEQPKDRVVFKIEWELH